MQPQAILHLNKSTKNLCMGEHLVFILHLLPFTFGAIVICNLIKFFSLMPQNIEPRRSGPPPSNDIFVSYFLNSL